MEWKPVLGFEGIYEVSDQGDVRRSLASQGTRESRRVQAGQAV